MPLLAAIVTLVLATGGSGAGDDKLKAEGFVPLFDGKSLDGWKVYGAKQNVWAAEDGLIVCKGAGGGWLGTVKEYANFELRLEYKIKPGGNSGVYIRAPETGQISRAGMEIQILDDLDPQYSKIDFYQYTGSIYHVVPPSRRAAKPPGQWNAMTIRADGRNVVVILNGKKIVDADLDHYLKDAEIAKEHPGLTRTTGRIGLQSHTDRVEFRNLWVKELKG